MLEIQNLRKKCQETFNRNSIKTFYCVVFFFFQLNNGHTWDLDYVIKFNSEASDSVSKS